MKNRTLSVAVLFLAALWTIPAFALPTFSQIVVIGDSLSDQGNISNLTGGLIPPGEYTDGTNTGRFTNGLNYIDYLSAGLGVTVTPSTSGGSNYAHGGARTDSASFGTLVIGDSLLTQTSNYITSLGVAPADPSALHVVWGGSNDLTDIIEGTSPIGDLPGVVADMADILGSLALAGAKTILVPNVTNLGLVPLVTGGGAPVAAASALVAGFNAALADVIDSLQAAFLDTRFIELDAFGLLTDVYNDPASSGFTNVSDACYSEFLLPSGTTCPNPDEYLSWDGFHPTTAAHRILADEMLRAVPVPSVLLLLVIGLAGIGFSKQERTA